MLDGSILGPSRLFAHVDDAVDTQKPTLASMYSSWVGPVSEMKGRTDCRAF